MVKIAILDTNSSANKGSIGRLEGMIKCLKETVPKVDITVFHRYYNEEKIEFMELTNKYPDVEFKKHLWFNEKNSFFLTGISFLINSISFNFYNKIKSKRFNEYDAFVDINLIEPEKLMDKRSFINFMGVLFVLFGVKNILSTKRPVIVCSATVGPYSTLLKNLARRFLNKVDLITFRETHSLKYVNNLRINKPKKVLTADLAFLMDPLETSKLFQILENLGIDKDNDSLVGISPAKMINSNFTEETYINIISDLSNFIIDHKYKIVYLANTYQDVQLIEKIYESIDHPENVIKLPFDYTAPETKGIISICDLFICSRFHALVASTSMAVPSLGIVSYSYNKFHGILGEMMQQEDCLLDINDDFDYNDFLSRLKSKVVEILNEKDEINRNLKEREQFVKNQALRNGKLIKHIINC